MLFVLVFWYCACPYAYAWAMGMVRMSPMERVRVEDCRMCLCFPWKSARYP